MQENRNKVVVATSLLCIASTLAMQAQSTSFDYRNTKLVATVNGLERQGELVLQDQDVCTFALVDKHGNQISSDNLFTYWSVVFYGGSERKEEVKELKTIDGQTKYTTTVSPRFWGMEVSNEPLASGRVQIDNYTKYYNDVKLVCRVVWPEADENAQYGVRWFYYEYEVAVMLNVLPPTPQMTARYIRCDTVQGDILPMVEVEIYAQNFNSSTLYGFYYIDENPNNPLARYNITAEITDPATPYVIETFLLPGDKLSFATCNDYGYSSTDYVEPYWGTYLSISDTHVPLTAEIILGKGFCEISSAQKMKGIRIFRADGRQAFSAENISHATAALSPGIYIIQITANNGANITKKIFIK